MPRAFHGAFGLVDLALRQRTVVMRATVFDPEQLAIAVHDREELALVFDDAAVTGLKFGDRADGNLCGFCAHKVIGRGSGKPLGRRPDADKPGQ